MPNTPAVDDAVAAALTSALPAEETVAPEAPENPAPPAAVATISSEGEVADEDVPLDYFGYDLSALPAAERATLIQEWKERDRATNTAQREAAELRKQQQQPSQDDAPLEYTDEQLAGALGINLEDDPDIAKVSLPLARALLEVRAEVDALKSEFTVGSETQRWQTAVEALEAQHGKLPVDFTTFVENAADQGIADPTAAYWAAVGPARAEFGQELEKRLQALSKDGKRSATTPRPRSSEDMVPAPVEAKNTIDAVDQAIRNAASKLGVEVK